jgi:hypothetical protein
VWVCVSPSAVRALLSPPQKKTSAQSKVAQGK